MRGIRMLLVAGLALAAGGAAAAEREVLVLRGRPAVPAAPPVAAAPAPRAVAGERLWLVDEARGSVTGCRLEHTTRVGERRIRCAERRLAPGRG